LKSFVWLAFDLFFLVLFTVVVGPPLAATAWLVGHLPLPTWALWGLAPLFAVTFLALLAGMTFIVRMLMPRLNPGTYAFPSHPQSVAWLLHFALQSIANFALWHRLIFSFSSLRFLMLRALGAKVAFNMQTSNDAMQVDPSLITVGENTMLAAGTLLACHFVENDHLMLAPIVVEPGAQIMGGVTLSPGTRIGRNSVVSPESKLLPLATVGEDAFLGLGCLLYNGVKVGNNAVIGHQCTLEADVIVGEGAVVQPHTRVPRGTVIEEGETYPPRAKKEAS
jgi:acetyltransferase-like isoleucine patch superfamily enzyme